MIPVTFELSQCSKRCEFVHRHRPAGLHLRERTHLRGMQIELGRERQESPALAHHQLMQERPCLLGRRGLRQLGGDCRHDAFKYT